MPIELFCYSYTRPISERYSTFWRCVNQIPDEKTGSERVDAVVVDEDAAGSVDMPGCGAKILRGDGALEQYLTGTNMNSQVCHLMSEELK
jgi:hypothetical protein